MRAWRVCKRRYAASAFDGEGAFRYGGRWNSPGTRVVYVAASPALAALEIIVNTDDPEDLFRIPYAVIPVEIPDGRVTRPVSLPSDWKQDPPPPSSAKVGDDWARAQASVALEVPSAVVPVENNYLLNPLHPDFRQLNIGDLQPFEFDPRLAK